MVYILVPSRGSKYAPAGGSIPSFATGMSPGDVRVLSSVSNGKPTMMDAPAAAWQADPTLNIPPGGGPKSNHRANMTTFCGGVGDPTNRYLYAHGTAGHSDGAYNGIARFDLNGSSSAVGWTEIAGSASDPSAVTQAPTAVTATYSDSRPSAVHSYGQMVLTNANELVRFGGSLWSQAGDETLAVWKFPFGSGAWSRLTDEPISFDLDFMTVYDPVTNKTHCNRDNGKSFFYRHAADTWSANKTPFGSAGGKSYTMGYDPTRGRIIVYGQDSLTRKDLATIDFVGEDLSGVTTFTPSGASCPLFTDNSSACWYDALLDCFWMFGGKNTTFDTLYRMTAGGFVVSTLALSQTIAAGTSFTGVYKRYCAMSDWRIIATVTGADQPVSIIKLPSS